MMFDVGQTLALLLMAFFGNVYNYSWSRDEGCDFANVMIQLCF